MKKIFVIAGMLSVGVFYAQQDGSVGINTQPSGATLDVQISADAVKTEGQGIAVPRVTKQQLSEMTGTIAEGALVYVNTIGAATGTAAERIAEVTDANGVGFYYFDKTKWVKVGGGASAATTLDMNKATGKIIEVAVPVAAASIAADAFLVIATPGGSNLVELPTPTEGRMLSISNQSASDITFTGSYQPVNMTKLAPGAGHLLMGHGNKWYVIGGLY